MDLLTLWLILVFIPGISVMAGICLILSSFVLICIFMERNYVNKYATIVFCISLVLLTTTPSSKQMKLIVGGYVLTNIEGINELPANLVNAANEFIGE